MSTRANWTACCGRALLSLIFIMSGVHKMTAWSETVAKMESEGMHMAPLMLIGAIAFEVLGGLSMMLGIRARIGASCLIIFLVPTTLIFHDFWTYEGQQQQMQMISFMKNLSILGGLMLVAALGPGGCCLIDGRPNSTAAI